MTEEQIQENPVSQFRGVNFKGEYSLPQDNLFQSWSPFGGNAPLDPMMEKYHQLKSELDMKIEEIESREKALQLKEKEIEDSFKKREDEMMKRQAEDEVRRVEQSSLIEQIVSKIQTGQKDIWQANVREMASFSLKLVEHLVGKMAAEDPECLIRQIQNCIEEAYEEDLITVHLCPEDLEQLGASQNDGFKKLLADKKIKWIGDLKLNRGEVIVDAKQYRMDASIEALLKNVRQDIMTGIQSTEDSPKTEGDNE